MRLLVDALPDAVLAVRQDGRISFANAKAEELFCAPRQMLVGLSIEDLLPEQWRERHAAWRAQYAANPLVRPMGTGLKLVAQRLDGTSVPVDISLCTLDVGNGPVVVAFIRDVSDRERLLAQVQEAERRYRMIVEQAAEAFFRIAYTDAEPGVALEFVSAQCERMIGHPPHALVNDIRIWIESVHPSDRLAVVEARRRLIETREPVTRTYRIRHGVTGAYRWISDHLVPILGDDGRVVGAQGTSRDITDRVRADEEREQLEARLRQAEKLEAIGHLAGGLAHDFNNILTVILGASEQALVRCDPSSPEARHVEAINRAAQRAADLTRQLLGFARRQQVAPKALDLNAHLAGLGGLLRRTIAESVEIAFDLAEGLWPVYIDPAQVDQIVINLAVNARDAMQGAGRLTISTANVPHESGRAPAGAHRPDGDGVLLTVRDTGCGMDEATLRRVFEPFFTTKPEGTGLGLASVYGIVSQNQGAIDMESAVGEGTTISVWLPRSHHAVDDGMPPAQADAAGGCETILLVEDNHHVRAVVRQILERLGYRVIEAADAAEALAHCEAREVHIRLLVSDVIMPGMSGVELADRVTRLRPGIRTMFISGYAGDMLARDGHEVPFLQKPFDQAVLARAVRRALDDEPSAR